jgi:hypothetical protein
MFPGRKIAENNSLFSLFLSIAKGRQAEKQAPKRDERGNGTGDCALGYAPSALELSHKTLMTEEMYCYELRCPRERPGR